MRPLRLLPSLALGLGIFASSGVAFAHKAGEPGQSGKNGGTCTGCHGTSGTQPSITVDLPDNVTANQSVTVKVTVTGTGTTTGFDGAFDNDAVVTPGTGARAGNGANELVQSAPMGATGMWTFTVKVPNRNGPLSLWVAAVSGNGDDTDNGDGVASNVFTSTISGSDSGVTDVPTDDPTTDPTTGTNGATTGGVDAGPPVIIPNPILPDGDPGCQFAPGGTPDVIILAGVGAVLLGLRRRRSSKRQ